LEIAIVISGEFEMVNTDRNEKWLDLFREWAAEHGEEYEEHHSEYAWKSNRYVCYMQQEENGDRDVIDIIEKRRGGELSATISNTVGSLNVHKRACGTIQDVDGTGEVERTEFNIHPVAGVKTRGEVGPYSRNEDSHLVLHSFDIDPRRGPDHEVADIEYVISVEEPE
jgi:hypothetical protein